MQPNMTKDIVIKALLMAVWRRSPKQEVIVHSDKGSQYASCDYREFLTANNLVPSMSHRGHCLDNAVVESFFIHLKLNELNEKCTKAVMKHGQTCLITLKCSTIENDYIATLGMCHPMSMKTSI